MSAIGQILDTVEARVRELLARFTEHEKKQDQRLDDLEARLTAVENRIGSPAAKAAPAAKARAGTATVRGEAQP